MAMNTTSVDAYLADGCGRCDLYQTPQCKVHLWTDALVLLRRILLDAGLDETMKWGSPCYQHAGRNAVLIGSFRRACSLTFLNAETLTNPSGRLEPAGPNARLANVLRFTSVEEVQDARPLILATLGESLPQVAAGPRPRPVREEDPVPEELQDVFAADPACGEAFAALTPGRRRSYVLHVNGAKKAATRVARAERCVPKILAGKGFNER